MTFQRTALAKAGEYRPPPWPGRGCWTGGNGWPRLATDGDGWQPMEIVGNGWPRLAFMPWPLRVFRWSRLALGRQQPINVGRSCGWPWATVVIIVPTKNWQNEKLLKNVQKMSQSAFWDFLAASQKNVQKVSGKCPSAGAGAGRMSRKCQKSVPRHFPDTFLTLFGK